MICRFISNTGLLVFWKCMNEEDKSKFIEEQRLSKINTKQISVIVNKAEDAEYKYNNLKNEIKSLNNSIKSGLEFVNVREILDNIEKDF
ncbi:hypothetical protein ACNSOL_11915 (plasmid) [Aliarcobacter lanthieri]|uniref:hypothetical protein n=1 Tax=Aliarcobacter lanthieri TaxID=1355374 RepID=UPI003AAC81C0